VAVLLPDGARIHVECAVAYVSECDDDYLIGLKFRDMDPPTRDAWQRYLIDVG